MDLKIVSGVKTYRSTRAKADAVPAFRTAAGDKSGVHTARLRFPDVLTAEQDGYIEINGERLGVPEELRGAIRQAYDTAMAYNQAIAARNAALQNAQAAEQQSKVLAEQAKAMRKAMEIYRRIASGGVVPPEDEQFLMHYSPEMYMAAKMEAMMAKEHKKYDSVLKEEEERTENAADDGTDPTVCGVEVEISTESASAADVAL